MKKLSFLLGLLSHSLILYSQNVGIGTLMPLAKLHVDVSPSLSNGVLVQGPFDFNAPWPDLGAGSRLMYYPGRGAFRAGLAETTEWNNAYVGYCSVAMGYQTMANGSTAFAAGYNTHAYGGSATALGFNTLAYGFFSQAFAQNTKARGDASLSTGFQTIAKSYAEVAIGRYNDTLLVTGPNESFWESEDALFVAGNGTSNVARSNAFVIYKNGNTEIHGYSQLGTTTENAPKIKMKKLVGTTPGAGAPNTWTLIPHGVNPAKILAIDVLVTDGGYQFLPHSLDDGGIYTVNVDPGMGGSISVGVKSVLESSYVMGKPIKILITYEE